MTDLLESLYTFLFKFPPGLFEKGKLALSGVAPVAVIAGVLLLATIPLVLSYLRVAGRARPRDRAVLLVIRAATLGLVCFCLAGPVLQLASAVPQRNFVGILIDDSRSMRIADEAGRPRAEAVRRLFGRDSALVQALAERFQLRFYRFAGTTERTNDPAALAFAGTWTRLGPALARAREELAQVPLAGLVLVTDGADQSPAVLADSLRDILSPSTPVFTVGLGAERFSTDIELVDVQSPASTLQGSTVAVDLTIRHDGYAGRTVQIRAEETGRILAAKSVKLANDGSSMLVRLLVPVADAGPRTLHFAVAPQSGEIVGENNHREATINVRRGPEKILYYEGEPRFELKFLRRAVAEDPNLQLAILQRTAEAKYLRLGIDDSLELVSGFPGTREELFAYRGVILGSVEASALTVEQLRILADFVSLRGGGLLLLGGRRAMAEGGYAGTPLARALPVTWGPADTTFFSEVVVKPTAAGVGQPALQLTGDELTTAERWRTLPPLTTVNRITGTKPGATVLLAGTGDGVSQPVLAFQRYGRGKAITFAVQDSWLWQMHADIPIEDQTHETLWRQLLRWLVSDVPERVAISLAAERAPPGEPVPLTIDVRDTRYDAVNDAAVTARITAPSGKLTEVSVPWSGNQDGEYRAAFVPDEEGQYQVAVQVAGDSTPGMAPASVTVGESDHEMHGATMQAALLRRIAAMSGGRFYTASNVASLPGDIAVSGAGVTVQEQRDLWDMPVIFLALVALLGTEWGFRRWRGLA